MDLGIAGRKAIVCASSRGLGRACAKALAEAGCEVVVNGLDKERLEATAAEIRKATGAKVIAVAADVATPEGQKALFAACPEPDILVNNNAGPPFRDFRELDRQKMIDGVIGNMIVPIELMQKAIDPMVARKVRPHRQHHLGLGEDAARRPRPVVGRARRASPRSSPASRARWRHPTSPSISCCRARSTPTACAPIKPPPRSRAPVEQAWRERNASVPAKRLGHPDEFGAACAFLCSAHAGFITGQNFCSTAAFSRERFKAQCATVPPT